ncbi:MAG TPA: radical SAM family heme chaperone HemW [Myxococcaceae bacterium]|nr:radical SAM family heme chaperone HemW [Myxococcaceae bacterium]
MNPHAPVDPWTQMSAARFGVYVHFPYCLSKCPYCDFASVALPRQGSGQVPEERYASAVLRELELRQPERRRADSIYFGGGTPSLWAPAWVERVLDGIRSRLEVAPGAEVTLEANPGASDASRFAGYRAAGVNRLSIGVQSFQPATLAFLGRGHDAAAAEEAFHAARAAGFDNVSLDFIYGVPGQTVAMAEADARRAAALGPEHLSAYALTLEPEALAEEVPLARQLARGEVVLPPEDAVIDMQRAVQGAYAEAGLARYEISNYARPGMHSRHNTLYWTGGEYLALGTGATGFIGSARYTNHRSPERYLESVERGAAPEANREPLPPVALFEERVAMGLRLAKGVDLKAICEAFGQPLSPREREVERLVKRGLATWNGSWLTLTPAGADLHSAISAALL